MTKPLITLKRFSLGIFLWCLILLALFLTIVVPPLVSTKLGLSAFQKGNFKLAASYWQQANRVVEPLGLITQPFFTDVATWKTSLVLGEKIANDFDLLYQQKQTASIYDLPTNILLSHLPEYLTLLEELKTNSASARVIRPILNQYRLSETISDAQDWIRALSPLFNRRSKWIVLLQNDNEIRATGGFMGSYAVVSINQGQIEAISIEDIYDADGQFKGFFPAPAGVKEYLSSGNGLRLPDSNWHPDFPSSAQQVLAYFALGKKPELDGVVAITNSVIGEMLKITGPIYLPDYQTSLTSDTIDSILQNRPQEFFPGSIQKKHLLSQAKNQLLSAITNLSVADWQTLFQVLDKQIKNNNVLFYSLDESVNQLFEKHQISGKFSAHKEAQDVLTIVESNVGINKSNQWQERTVTLNLKDVSHPTVTVKYHNQAPKTIAIDQAKYVNYLRLLTDHSWKLETVQVNNTIVTESWQQDLLTTIAGDSFFQAGGLVEVPPDSTINVTAVFNRTKTVNQSLLLIKQPGLPETHYTVLLPNGASESLILQNHYELLY